MRASQRTRTRERGQTLPIFAMLLVAFIGLTGLAIDAGRVYIARAELVRALDAAALAGVIELPDEDAAEAKALAYMDDNEPGATTTFPLVQTENQFRVQGSRSVNTIFMRIMGRHTMTVNAAATAGFGTVPSDTVVLVDATGSMGASPCDAQDDNPGCPIHEAKQGALAFNNLFLGSGSPQTQVGYTPFRGCHNPPRTDSRCVTNAMRVDLSSNKSTVDTAINNTTAIGGTGTNVCLALFKAQEMFNGPNAQTASNTVKSLVILTDGDNTYNSVSWQSPNSPPSNCRPNSPNHTTSDAFVGTGCSAPGGGSASSSNPGSVSETRERSVDTKTKTLADTLRAANIEIYVIAFGVCGTNNSDNPSTPNYCSSIGNTNPDTVADQRLLKCIASSTANTNDHYYAVPTAADLPEIFEDIARAIAFRLIE
jgi:Flp pilus assembly protein TadG